jgi:hypothetical protein
MGCEDAEPVGSFESPFEHFKSENNEKTQPFKRIQELR